MIKFRQTSTAFANRKTAPQPIAGHRTAILFVLNFSKTVFSALVNFGSYFRAIKGGNNL